MKCILYSDLARVVKSLGVGASDVAEDFEVRVRLQKVVYLMQVAGLLRSRCAFNMYLRGPYSRDLADDYMELARMGDEMLADLAERSSVEVPEFLARTDVDVLEAAATLHSIMEGWMERYGGYDLREAVEHLLWLKPWAEGRLEEVFGLLRLLGLLDGPR